MSVAAKPEPPASPVAERAKDSNRLATLRHAMHLLIPNTKGKINRLVLLELRDGLRLSLDLDDDGIGVSSVDLSCSEAIKLGDMLNTMRRRVATRPGWMP